MIHGGGYNQGNSIGNEGSQFVSFADGELIYVAIQYRLGPFGFLASKDVKADGTANAGLLDQRLALEWIQQHIGAFGGDPDRVTIWGGSAGGGSITNQMIMYGGSQKAPFNAAIAEYPWWQPFHDDSALELQYQLLLNTTGCTSLQCLRNLDADTLMNASSIATDAAFASEVFAYGDYWWGPAVDGTIIRDLPSREYAAGHFWPVPVLTDRDAYEGVSFTNFSISSSTEVQQSLSPLWFSAETTSKPDQRASFFDRLLRLYPETDFTGSFFNETIFTSYFNLFPTLADNSAYWQRQAIFGDYSINCPTYTISKALVDAGQIVYKMIFAAGTQLHAADSSYLLEASNRRDNPSLADTLKDYFVGFITQFDPNDRKMVQKPFWPRYTTGACRTDANLVLRMEDRSIYTQHDADASERCRFFASQGQLVRN